MMTQDDEMTNSAAAADPQALSLDEFTTILQEIQEQPPWRGKADKEADYIDGNQLDTELLKKQKERGIPPACENIMRSAIESVCGFEAKTRKDWRLSSEDGVEGEEVAAALGFKLNQAERQSGADKACSKAFRAQFSVGIGWVEVSRESDPFLFAYRCAPVHRNEIWWDMTGARENPDMTKCRWLVRRRWMDKSRIILSFPDKKELIERCDGRWSGRWEISMDGSTSTGLMASWEAERGWSIEEQEWLDATRNRMALFEVWYRRWENVPVLKSKDGRVVEYDITNPAHDVAIASGAVEVFKATVSRVRRAYMMGPHVLHDGPSPYKHKYFAYAPFFGWEEDRTGVPYGAARDMIFAQDSLNSAISKLRWGISAVRTERTKGAVAMTDQAFRQQVGRVDADIILDAQHMAQPGAKFDVKRDYQLTDQHYQLMQDSRATIERSSGITSGFQGKTGTATSGIQEQTQVEQSNQGLAALMDNFSYGRAMVGEMLLSMIIEDAGSKHETVAIKGDAVRPDRIVELNRPTVDEATGVQYLTNDIQRIRLKVSMEDVPTTSSFRSQQLTTLGEAVKSMPANMQAAVMPFMVGLMDLPYKKEVIDAIRAAAEQESPEGVEKRIQEAVKDALAKAGYDLKARQVAIQENESDAKIRKLVSETVQTGVQSAFSAMQAAQVIATMPQVAPVADVVMQGAGYQRPNPAGVDPNFPQPQIPGVPAPAVHENTSPEFPPIPEQAGTGMAGIETQSTADNMAQQP
jgi:hypothetical protein